MDDEFDVEPIREPFPGMPAALRKTLEHYAGGKNSQLQSFSELLLQETWHKDDVNKLTGLWEMLNPTELLPRAQKTVPSAAAVQQEAQQSGFGRPFAAKTETLPDLGEPELPMRAPAKNLPADLQQYTRIIDHAIESGAKHFKIEFDITR